MSLAESAVHHRKKTANIVIVKKMTNLAKRPPMGLKRPKETKDEKYLEKIREKPCVICRKFGYHQTSPTTAHHPIHDRYGTRKRSDRSAIPLCEGHHQGLWDQSKVAIHKEPIRWRELYGPDWSHSDHPTEP